MFWFKKVDQNFTPSVNVEKSPENSASLTLENFDQVLAAFIIQRSGGIETSIENPQDFKAW